MNPEAKLRREGLPEEAVAAFRGLYDQLVAGASGTLPDAELTPVRDLPTLASLPRPAAPAALSRTCVIKLNGGLGTSMGLDRAKSLLEARDGLSFLDVIARQVGALRERHRVRLPLVLMHSFRTREDSLAALDGVPDVLDFLQHKVPKLRADDLSNLWLDLEALSAVPDLPLIVNRKTVDPSDPESTVVIQTETAMGAAIGVFDGARALCVPRSRFVPVKTTDDLLALRSDVYRLLGDGRVEGVAEPPYIALDPSYFKRIADFEARFEHGAPSLRECRRFVVRGDVSFGRDIVARARVEVCADVPDDTTLSGVYRPAVETLR